MTTSWPLVLIISIALLACSRSGEDSIFLIPDKFEGNVIIMFNQKEGAKTEYDSGTRVYHIPESGMIKTQFSPNYGTRHTDRFYFNKEEQNNGIRYLTTLDDTTNYAITESLIYNVESGTQGDLHFLVLSVVTRNTLDSILSQRSEFVWKAIQQRMN